MLDPVEMWAGSVRRYHERRRQEARAQWYGWHLDQAERHRRTLEDLIAHHEEKAARLCEDPVSPAPARGGQKDGTPSPNRSRAPYPREHDLDVAT
jgi:hypothetical protein